ncbi:MAG: Tfp pilus biogenesis protein PilC [Candidatus Roizmanbacteria bacterium GW2011_GWA2_32_13]|uniref:Tfp pilus biogenesis protein PilC n=1 Tax=Candidatus Roizmanbacteria bacterium GW2011_GWA2_32_13 TaxID=1618475 RepID=A0A0G0C2D8_9BACT|nr:MAG: Tfp pilus biogenesis protein PilC [Candidatus Roizmanbacteria bacterium GW2011_GWA2_32_13]
MKTENISISNSDKMGFLISLSTMLSSGITLVESVDSILEDAKGNLKIFLTILKDDIQQGKRIYLSLSKFPNIFDKVTVNLIKAAEEAGTLDSTLKQVQINLKKDTEFTDKVKSALTYPLFIFVVFVGVFLMILIFVIPKISKIFLSLKLDLPLPTKILIFLSDFILKSTVPILVGLMISIIFLYFLYKLKKRALIQFIFSLPIVSGLIQKIDLTRLTRSLNMLLSSGVNISYSLDLIEDIVINKNIVAMIAYAKENVAAGKSLASAFRKYKKYVPSLIIRVIEAGEKSGHLDKSLLETSEYLDYEVTNTLKSLTALLEPIMLVVIGVMVGGMMLSIIAPMYGLISQVGGAGN